MLQRMFVDHPQAVGETYGEHFRVASRFGFSMLVAGLACLVHALIPGLFVHTGSACVKRLHEGMVLQRKASRSSQ